MAVLPVIFVWIATVVLLTAEILSWKVQSPQQILVVRLCAVLLTAALGSILSFIILGKERHFKLTETSLLENLQANEERLNEAMTAARMGSWDWNILADQQVWSDSSRKLLGLPLQCPADLETLMSAIHPDDRLKVSNAMERAIEEKKEYAVDFRSIWPDGSVHWIGARGHVIANATGRATRLTGVAFDIDDRKLAEAQLQLQAAALEAAANSIVITDAQGTIVWVNSAFSKLSGYSTSEVLGKNPRILNSGQHTQKFYSDLWSTISGGGTWQGEIINRRKDGTIYHEEMTITPVWTGAGEIGNFIAIKQDVTERRRAEDALRQAEEKYRTMFEDATVGIYQSTPDGKFLSVNRALARICGYESPEQQIAETHDLGMDWYSDPTRREEFKRAIEAEGVIRNFEFQAERKDGTKLWFLQNARAVRNEQGETLYYEGTVHDLTERKVLEDQFRQAQKMEAVGRLAGGVAHDFNNMLGVINGYSELLQLALPDGPLHHHALEIQAAGRRAAGLTRQLLAFSRKQTVYPTVFDMNSVITEMEKMLRRLIGEDVLLTVACSPSPKNIRADRSQIEQILMNIVVNARDAMPGGGRLLIETFIADLDELYIREHAYAKPGRYVALSISDTGCGMDKDIQAHIFEPFFTTKEIGKGTGLGLSTVYGIVKQSEGCISVYSEVGRGTTFKIYLPFVQGTSQPATTSDGGRALPTGSETVLLVEDEEILRGLARACLENSGYQVIEAQSGTAALQLAEQHDGPINLLLTDVVMPGVSGRELADRLTYLRPELKVLFMSGYTHDLVTQHGVLQPGVTLLEKPFAIGALLTKVRAVLDGKV